LADAKARDVTMGRRRSEALNPHVGHARCAMRRLLPVLVPLLAFVGCGGGGAGSSVSSSAGPSSVSVGTYVGAANATLSLPQGSRPVFGSIRFVVSPDQTVSGGDAGQPHGGVGTLDGNVFVIIEPGSIVNRPGLSCAGSITFAGTIAGASISGTVSSSGLTCNGVSISVDGTFTATLQAQVMQGRVAGDGLIQELRDTLGSP
jgi:hypothetical protein